MIKKLSSKDIANIHKLKEEGLSGREIAERMKVSLNTIWYHLNPNAKKNMMKYQKKWKRNKMKKDPKWNAERQREFRKKHPISFYKMMARYYLRKLSKEVIKSLLKEIGYER